MNMQLQPTGSEVPEIKAYMAKFAAMPPEQRRRHMALIAAWIIRLAEEKGV